MGVLARLNPDHHILNGPLGLDGLGNGSILWRERSAVLGEDVPVGIERRQPAKLVFGQPEQLQRLGVAQQDLGLRPLHDDSDIQALDEGMEATL